MQSKESNTSDKEKKPKLVRRSTYLVTTMLLLLSVIGLYIQKNDAEFQLLYEKSIPDIELFNHLEEEGGIYYGEVRGFVLLDDQSSQPTDFRQYYVFQPLMQFDDYSNQVFSLEQIVKLDHISPRTLDVSTLYISDESIRMITFVDEYDNEFFLNKQTFQFSFEDSGGDRGELITDELDFGRYIRNRLNE